MAARADQILDQIEANQRRFERELRLSRRYQLLVANERMWASLGVRFPPLRTPGLLGWWLRRKVSR